MKSLIVKELLENRACALGALAVTAVLLTLGAPLDFAGNGNETGWVFLAALAAAIMGLSAYSRDFAGDLLSFTLSRPVRWWWVYLSKLLAGAIACAAVGIAAAILYSILAPVEYRPFMNVLSILAGAASWAGFLALFFAIGFMVACALPGMAVSVALLLGLAIAWAITQPLLLSVHSEFWPSLSLLAALAAASVACAVSPRVLQTWPRFRRWLAIIVAGFGGMVLTAFVLPHFRPAPPEGLVAHVSPDVQATAYGTETNDPDMLAEGLWVGSRGTRNTEIEKRGLAHVLSWSPDSQTVYYAIIRNGTAHVKAVSRGKVWKKMDICTVPLGLPKGDRQIHPMRQPLANPEDAWSPSGRRLFVKWEHGLGPVKRSHSLTVLDIHSRRAWRVNANAWVRYWWLDDEHLGTTGGNVISVE